MTDPDLTICTVYTSNDVPYIQANARLIAELNVRESWRWLLVDNSDSRTDIRLETDDHRRVVVEGVESDKAIPEWCRGSYQHAAALNKVASHLQTRFVLFLDPDLYIVKRGWIKAAIAHMVKNGLSFFGVPYSPKWYGKYRYFPTAHCLFVDLQKIPGESLDFTPDVVENGGQPGTPSDTGQGNSGGDLLNSGELFRRVKGNTFKLLRLSGRGGIGSTKDTGYRVFGRYSRDRGTRYESASPVYEPRAEFRGPMHALSWPSRLVERVLPDRLSFFPKRPGYYTKTGFRELGYPDVRHMGWEEFIWQDRPFSFHIRRTRRGERDLAQEQATLLDVLERVTKIGQAA